MQLGDNWIEAKGVKWLGIDLVAYYIDNGYKVFVDEDMKEHEKPENGYVRLSDIDSINGADSAEFIRDCFDYIDEESTVDASMLSDNEVFIKEAGVTSALFAFEKDFVTFIIMVLIPNSSTEIENVPIEEQIDAKKMCQTFLSEFSTEEEVLPHAKELKWFIGETIVQADEAAIIVLKDGMTLKTIKNVLGVPAVHKDMPKYNFMLVDGFYSEKEYI